jgi:hypothetical protein
MRFTQPEDFLLVVECVFDQICSFGLYVIRLVMFLCFWVQFRTKQTIFFFAYVIICVFMFLCFRECSNVQSGASICHHLKPC